MTSQLSTDPKFKTKTGLEKKAAAGDIFIVVPAYNEAFSIKNVSDQLLKRYSNIVVVDDGSRDDTSEILKTTGVFFLRHIINRGQGAALQTGIDFCLKKGAVVIVTFDADGQHDVDDIEALVKPIFNGECDVTLGSRFLGRAYNMPFSKKMLLKTGILFTRIISRIRVNDVHNGLRAFSRKAAASLSIRTDGMGHASEILDHIVKERLRYKEVPVNIYYSKYSLAKGQSSWNALKIAFRILIERLAK